ncbi:hypothetical protein FTH_0523 [Francisella tularensis subsp. holarctica OSU18]|nr:hypothetical protein FTH_0523 [Francisella tularensis subsp. holarctica OSU18]ADA79247.1 hypothetical protein NE061598_08990 [Francisella tularensis subsp. tularensis NE061598]
MKVISTGSMIFLRLNQQPLLIVSCFGVLGFLLV